MSLHAGVALAGKNSQKCSSHCQIHHINNTDHLLMDFSTSSSPVLLRPLEPASVHRQSAARPPPVSGIALDHCRAANSCSDWHCGFGELFTQKPACGNQHRLAAPQKREGIWRKSHFFVGRICATFLRHQNALCLGLFSK